MTDFPPDVDSLPLIPDLVIAGGGVVGLWCALRAIESGLKPVVLDAGRIGQGASNGLLGGLMPHQPANWTAKKQFQLDGLLELEVLVADLEARTGLSCGYARCGRLTPLTNDPLRQRNLGWGANAVDHWPTSSPGGTAMHWRVHDENLLPQWISSASAPFGFVHDTLSARISPRLLVAALKKRLAQFGAILVENCAVANVDGDGRVHLAGGKSLTPGAVILAAGYQTFGLAPSIATMPRGSGVKGQSALLRPVAPADPAWPMLYDDGVYVIAHDDGVVAVGSTSENQWDGAGRTDQQLDALIARAASLCPVLQGATVVERWAGVRPKGPTAAPLVHPLDGAPRVILATGGFKITFAIAHKMADQAVAQVLAAA